MEKYEKATFIIQSNANIEFTGISFMACIVCASESHLYTLDEKSFMDPEADPRRTTGATG